MNKTKYLNHVQEYVATAEDNSFFENELTDTIYEDFDSYEATKSLFSLIRRCETKEEYDLIDMTCIAITGWCLATIVGAAEKRK